jgi:hypothetical protein
VPKGAAKQSSCVVCRERNGDGGVGDVSMIVGMTVVTFLAGECGGRYSPLASWSSGAGR